MKKGQYYCIDIIEAWALSEWNICIYFLIEMTKMYRMLHFLAFSASVPRVSSHLVLISLFSQRQWQGSYAMSPKKIQDFSRTFKDLFLNFPGRKKHESTADFHSIDMFRTMLRSVAQGKKTR